MKLTELSNKFIKTRIAVNFYEKDDLSYEHCKLLLPNMIFLVKGFQAHPLSVALFMIEVIDTDMRVIFLEVFNQDFDKAFEIID